MKYESVDIAQLRFNRDYQHEDITLKELRQLFGEHLLTRSLLHQPILLEKGDGTYEVVGNYASYDVILCHAGDVPLQAIIVTESELESVRAVLSMEKELLIELCKKRKLRHDLSASGKSRQRRQKAGQTCPFCSEPLLAPLKNQPAVDVGYRGSYRVTCRGKLRRTSKCGFVVFLTPEEFARFKQNKYATRRWLIETHEHCPKCNGKLFLRIRPDKKSLGCLGNLISPQSCTYRKEITADNDEQYRQFWSASLAEEKD